MEAVGGLAVVGGGARSNEDRNRKLQWKCWGCCKKLGIWQLYQKVAIMVEVTSDLVRGLQTHTGGGIET